MLHSERNHYLVVFTGGATFCTCATAAVEAAVQDLLFSRQVEQVHGFSGSSFCPKHGPSIFHCEFSLCLKEFSTRLDGSESSDTMYNLLQPLGVPFFYTACASLAYRGHYD